MIEVLDQICRIANERQVTPRVLVSLYNQYIAKSYTYKDKDKAMALTDRFARRYFDKRENSINWNHHTYTEFRRDKRG